MVVDFGVERDAYFERCQREPGRITMKGVSLAQGESSFLLAPVQELLDGLMLQSQR